MRVPTRRVSFSALILATASVAFAVPERMAQPAEISALEIVSISSRQRSVVYRAEGRMESPVFSADGNALYFSHSGRIERIDLTPGAAPHAVDTGDLRRCNNDHGVSPDGTQLAISDLTATGQSLMYLVPIGGGTPTRIAVGPPAYWHSWSPDGATLAYCAARNGNYDIYTIPVAGGAETRLTSSPANDNGPDYTPDGKFIYFHSDRSGSVQIWRMRADGSAQEPVTNDAFENWFPHPSPDGKWIAILSTRQRHETGHPPDGEYVLRLLPTSGHAAPEELVRFHGGNGVLNVPCWSRDSTRIAYSVYSTSDARDASKR